MLIILKIKGKLEILESLVLKLKWETNQFPAENLSVDAGPSKQFSLEQYFFSCITDIRVASK